MEDDDSTTASGSPRFKRKFVDEKWIRSFEVRRLALNQSAPDAEPSLERFSEGTDPKPQRSGQSGLHGS
jgi:hypothetical protein